MRKCLLDMVVIISVLICTSCASFSRIDGPYEGKVVDADSKQPLEGVVVLGVWYKVYPNVAGSTSEFYDSVELLTDKNGDFKIPGKGLQLFSNLDEMNVIIFKAGYAMMGDGPWSGFRTRTGGKYVNWNGDRPTFLLRKLSHAEKIKNIPTRPNIDQSRMHLLTDEINKVRIEFGFNPL